LAAVKEVAGLDELDPPVLRALEPPDETAALPPELLLPQAASPTAAIGTATASRKVWALMCVVRRDIYLPPPCRDRGTVVGSLPAVTHQGRCRFRAFAGD
jgi:hypothetical protein